jgi:hypothetical protein
MHRSSADNHRRLQLLSASLIWLFIGSVLLLSTLVPAHTALFGWTPTFWLLVAPLTVALTLEPRLPRLLLKLRRTRRRKAAQLIWN